MPLISVIIPTCNGRARFVDQALASVAAQTFQDFELIIVDDASTDGTLEYIQDLMPKIMAARPDTPIVYAQRETNGGEPVAQNDGANRANGELLAFLDQDDLWEPTFLEETSQLLHNNGTGTAALFVDGYCINANQDIVCYLKNRETNIQYKYHSITSPLCDGYNVPIQGSLLRKEAFETIKGFDENIRILEDRDFVIRLIQHYRVAYIPKPLYSLRRYRLAGGGGGGGGGGWGGEAHARIPSQNSPLPAEHIFWKNMRPAVGTTRVYEKPCNTNGACCTATWANIIFPRINERPPARGFVNPSGRFLFPEERGFAICVPICLLSHRRVGDGDPVSRHGRSATRSPLPSDGDVSSISYAFAYFAKV